MKPYIWIPATLALVYRAYSHNSLTPIGIFAATLTAIAHAIHPWSVFFALLATFFLAGSRVTKVKHDVKAKLTQTSGGGAGGEGPRNWIQVLANSGVASVLIVWHAYILRKGGVDGRGGQCWRFGAKGRAGDVLVVGIVANYAAVAADTFSSELGILSTSKPRLITAPWRIVPPGTNGGVTATGIHAGILGAFIIGVTATLLIPFCGMQSSSIGNPSTGWDIRSKSNFALTMTLIGLGGTLLDSALGATLQASVVDVRSGKVVEGDGGRKVLIHGTSDAKKEDNGEKSRRIDVGYDILSNNGVNLVMAVAMSLIAMVGAAWLWEVPLQEVVSLG